MKSINAVQRNSAYLYFLLMFLVTTALVVLAVFFGMQVPFRQNEKLKQQLSVFQAERAFADNFSAAMTDVQLYLDSINKPSAQPEVLNAKILAGIANLNAMIDKDTSGMKAIYKDVVHNLSDLKDAKSQLRDASNNSATIAQYQQKIAELQEDLRIKLQENSNLNAELQYYRTH